MALSAVLSAVLSGLVFTVSWWLGLYLAARDPRKPVLALVAVGLCGFAAVVAVDAVRTVSGADWLSSVEIYLVAVPGVAWFGVVLELARPPDCDRSRAREAALTAVVAVLMLCGAALAGSVEGPLRPGHWVMFATISAATLAAMVAALRRPAQPARVAGILVVATLFFVLGNAIIVIPLGLLPSWLAMAATSVDLLLLGTAVVLWDAFDEGQVLRAAMLRSFLGTIAVAALFGGQVLAATLLIGPSGQARIVLTLLLFSSLAIAIAITVLADPLAGLLDRLAFSRSPKLLADRAALRTTEAALPLRSPSPLSDLDDETFARLTRRALSHYGDLAKLVASPLTQLPEIDARLAERRASDQPLERAAELRAILAERIDRLKPRDGGEFGTTEQWRYYNALYFPYVVGVRAYAQNATAAGLDPVARQAWQWLVTDVPQRSLHNWQNAAARLIAADLRAQTIPVRH
ncbi:MAG: hypothetical protein KDB71_08270 [Mycobacterium sp.]|nr:hypothetical protein [Mycobacterium sp.]